MLISVINSCLKLFQWKTHVSSRFRCYEIVGRLSEIQMEVPEIIAKNDIIEIDSEVEDDLFLDDIDADIDPNYYFF